MFKIVQRTVGLAISRLSFYADLPGNIESSKNMNLLFNAGTTFSFNVGEGSVSGGPVSRITALSGGNCGINNPSPQAALDVRSNTNPSNFRIWGNSNGDVSSTTHMKLWYDNNINGTDVFEINQGPPTPTPLFQRFTIDGNGYATVHQDLAVGALAAGSPARLAVDGRTKRGLDITGDGGNDAILVENTNGVPKFRVQVGTGVGDATKFFMYGSGQFGFYQNAGNTLVDNTTRLNIEADGGINGVKVTTINNNTKAFFVENTNFTPNNTFVVFGDGRTQIGTGTPSVGGVAAGAMLTFDGMILARDIRVSISTGSHWADYVFDKNFKLPALAEVEKYVQKNKHLPDVPSEADVKAEGMDVTGMSVVLLKKVEELFLYTIDLKKQNEKLEQQIEKLSKEVKAVSAFSK